MMTDEPVNFESGNKAKRVKVLFNEEVKPDLVRDFKGKLCTIYSQGLACDIRIRVSSFEVETSYIKNFGPAVYVFALGDLVRECQHEKNIGGCAKRSVEKFGYLKWYVDGVQNSLQTTEEPESLVQFLSNEIRSHIYEVE